MALKASCSISILFLNLASSNDEFIIYYTRHLDLSIYRTLYRTSVALPTSNLRAIAQTSPAPLLWCANQLNTASTKLSHPCRDFTLAILLQYLVLTSTSIECFSLASFVTALIRLMVWALFSNLKVGQTAALCSTSMGYLILISRSWFLFWCV